MLFWRATDASVPEVMTPFGFTSPEYHISYSDHIGDDSTSFCGVRVPEKAQNRAWPLAFCPKCLAQSKAWGVHMSDFGWPKTVPELTLGPVDVLYVDGNMKKEERWYVKWPEGDAKE